MAVVSGIVFFSSCEKQNDEISTLAPEEIMELPFAVSNDNGVLNFETKDDYELALDYLVNLERRGELDQFEDQLGFESYRLRYQDNIEKMNAIQDDILATFLNPEKNVVVGKYLFQINMAENKVSVWDYQVCDLKSANTDLLVGEFHCDDDVFGMLEGKPKLKSVQDDVVCPHSKVEKENQGYAVDDGQYLVSYHYLINYIKGGIYYTLNARISQDYTKTRISINSTHCEYRKIRESLTTVDPHSESGENWERNYRPYWRLKRLASFNFSVTFSASIEKSLVGGTEHIFTDALNNTCID